jgi:hypothetical protein
VRRTAAVAGGLAATIDQTGTAVLQLTNMHGDLLDTAADDPAATGPLGYTESTEYGAPRNPATAPDTYGWLGATQRSTNDLAGLTLMGLRLYNPSVGRFLSIDSVPGASAKPSGTPRFRFMVSTSDRCREGRRVDAEAGHYEHHPDGRHPGRDS